MILRPSLCLALGLGASAAAAEAVRRDAVLAVEALPTDFSYTLTAPGYPTRTGDDGLASAYGARLGLRWAWSRAGSDLAAVGGVEARVADATYGEEGSFRTLGAGVTLGGTWALAERVALIAEGLVEFGTASLTLPAGTSTTGVAARGPHLATGGRSGLLYALDRRWLVGFELGWLSSSDQLTDGEVQVDIEQSGPMAALSVIWRARSAPASLE